MKVLFVVPRYGTEVVGGAELGARMLAERLAALPGWSVAVATTRARDARTWENEYPAGTGELAGVAVSRHTVTSGRHVDHERLSARLFSCPWAASAEEADRWLRLQGPVSPDLVDAVVASDADVVVFYPYLYHPTVSALPLVGGGAVLQPAAHDEPPLYLPCYDAPFAAASGFVFQTDSERRLVERRFALGQSHQVTVGLGISPPPAVRGDGAASLGLGDRPYLLCLGRVDDPPRASAGLPPSPIAKGTSLLVEYFRAYKERHPGPLALALVGPVVRPPAPHPDVVLTGEVSEQVKWDVLADALALVSPSGLESFSLVLMEAWSLGRPVIVNAACGPTREHVERSGAGTWFGSYGDFEVGVERLASDAGLRERLGGAGKAYVERNYGWPIVLRRYARFLEAVAERTRAS